MSLPEAQRHRYGQSHDEQSGDVHVELHPHNPGTRHGNPCCTSPSKVLQDKPLRIKASLQGQWEAKNIIPFLSKVVQVNEASLKIPQISMSWVL